MTFNPFLIYANSILYLVVPILFFFLGWLKLGIGIILSLLLLLSSYIFLKKVKGLLDNAEVIQVNKECWISLVILLLFLLSTGNTGFVGSWGVDIPWRNAIYQDLIHQSWPVKYDYSNSMLCYYMVFWLVPAEISSILHLDDFGSNVVLFLWMYIGLILIFLLLCDVIRPQKEYIVFTIVLFLFFSGINTFGMILKSIFFEPTPLITDVPERLSWSFSDFSINGIDTVLIIRSIYLCVADVYNQFFAIAIATLLFLRLRKNTEVYAFIGLLALPYSPLGFIGIFIIQILELTKYILKSSDKKSLGCKFMSIISYANILAVISIIPIFYFYFFMNSNAEVLLTSQYVGDSSFLSIPISKFSKGHLVLLFFYYYFYFLIYARLIFNSYKKESLYYGALFCLIIFPFFKIGKTADFNFNATICPYILLFVLIVKHLLSTLEAKNFGLKEILLLFFLSIAMLTPIVQISTSIRAAYIHDSYNYKWTPWNPKLSWNSFKDKDINLLRNFLVSGYEKKVFFKYFAKQ